MVSTLPICKHSRTRVEERGEGEEGEHVLHAGARNRRAVTLSRNKFLSWYDYRNRNRPATNITLIRCSSEQLDLKARTNW